SQRPLLTAELDVRQTLFSADDRFLAWGWRGSQPGLLELIANAEFRRMHGQPSGNRGSWSLDPSPDGRLLAASNIEGVRLWDLRRGRELAVLPIDDCRSVMFTPDGRALVTCGMRGLERWPVQITEREKVDECRIGRPQALLAAQPLFYGSLRPDGQQVAAVV